MNVVIDIEGNGLKPTHVWVVVCKCVETGEVTIFRRLTDDQQEKERFLAYAKEVTGWIGHNILEYDLPVLYALVGLPTVDINTVSDTLIISRLVDYSRPGGHSIEQYGEDFGYEKDKFSDFTKYSEELERRCAGDVEISDRVRSHYSRVLSDPDWQPAIRLEHRFQLVVNDLHNNGFCFDSDRATRLLERVSKELEELDGSILEAFPPRETLVRTFTPKLTKFGTISRTSVPRSLWDNILLYEAGKEYRHTKQEPFNPSSHKQLIQVLTEAGWKPDDKTQTHIDTERIVNQLRNKRKDSLTQLQYDDACAKLETLKIKGYKVNEHNLSTLPESAPAPARLLAKRILLEARRRSLTEWLGLVQPDGRIHGKFYGIGAWTHRMAHQKPNTANIPNSVKISDGSERLLGKEMRQLWCAPKNRLLVGVDAEAIQFRIFAHMIDDKGLIEAIVNGKKSDKTDPHSINQVAFGPMCKTRNAAKHSMFALFFGGRANKISQIMGCSKSEAEEAIQNLLKKYPGLKHLEEEVFPSDARKGYFVGLDGRKVPIPGDTLGARKHLCMSGYLQNGEKVIMAKSAVYIDDQLKELKESGKWKFIAIVHDALDSEVRNDMHLALKVAKIKADAIRIAGEDLNMKCPLAGSFFNDDTKEYTIGRDWYATH